MPSCVGEGCSNKGHKQQDTSYHQEMNELKFDEMVIDTKLAEEFLETHKKVLNSLQECKDITDVNEDTRNSPNSNICETLKTLATKVEENAELFAQLEFLKRGIPKDEVKNHDIKLITQNLKYWSSSNALRTCDNYIVCTIKEDTPLAHLGYLAQYLHFVVEYSQETLAVCYLFARLCGEVGFTIMLKKYDSHSEEKKGENLAEKLNSCTGVITDHSDLESAVDTMLATPTKKPWKLHRLYVQESVYERVKKSLAWKCNLKRSCNDGDRPSSLATGTLYYDQKIFLFDYAGALEKIETTKQVILVEAYRTTKELLSLVEKEAPFCMSLWSSDVSESNEIAFGVSVPVVWVNDFGAIDDCFQISQAFYSTFEGTSPLQVDDRLHKMIEIWSKLDTSARIAKIKAALAKFKSENVDEATLDFIEDLEKAGIDLDSNKFVEIENGKMWVGIKHPKGVILLRSSGGNPIFDAKYFRNYLISVAHGNTVLFEPYLSLVGSLKNEKHEFYSILFNLLSFFEKENLPFKDMFKNTKEVKNKIKFGSSLYQTRVVHINYGTIFAN